MSLPTDFPSCNVCASGRTSLGKHTCWRGETDSESAEEPPSATQQHTTDNQPKGPGSVKDGGHQFEMKMAALIGLRGLQRGDNFELFSNIDGAGNFDDLVYTSGDRRYFLQLKHADNPDKKKLTKGDLVTLLQKCFNSYCAIKKDDTFEDIPIENTEFIIYTNKELTRELLEHERRKREEDVFFKTSDKGETFSFSPNEKNKEFDLYTLLENYLKESKEFRNFCNQHIVTDFLNKLIMVTGQKGQRELDEVIKEEIRKDDTEKFDNEVHKTELLEFKTQVEAWCRDTKDKMTATMFRNWLQEAKTKPWVSVVRNLFKSCTKKFARTGIKFSDSEILRLQAEISNKNAVHLRSDALTLCNILLLDCLPQSQCIFVNFKSLQSNKNMLLHAWLGGHWECLIVSCDSTVPQSDLSKTCLKMSEVIKPDPSGKRVIIVTEYSVQQVTGFVPIDHRLKFEQLSDESQAMVLDKKIDFQGCEVTMRSVLQRHGNVEHVLGPVLVTDLITEGTAVNIGGKLHVNTGYYAPRVLEKKVWLQLNVLRNPNDVFAVSGITEDMNSRTFLLPYEDVEDSFLAICEKHEGKPLHWVELKNGGLLWKMSRGGTDSLLDYVDTEKTRADKRIIAECIKIGGCEVNEESIWDLGERTVLVVAEPGMGKSSTTTHVAWHTKQRDPTSWVVRINWNDHTRELQEINAATFNLDTLVKFLCSAAFPDSKYTDINRSLLKQALQSSGNVTVLMDGFDEISPTYADKAAAILSELTKTKVGRLWVTSRPVVKERLEKQMSVIAYDMKRLALKSQEDMLIDLWKNKAGEEELNSKEEEEDVEEGEEEEEDVEEGEEASEEESTNSKLMNFIKFLLCRLKYSLHDNFTGCPLYITMITTVYEMEVETWLNTEDWIDPKIDLVNLYEKFVERKLHIYLTEKQKADITNSSVIDNLEFLKQTYLINFEKCALAAILPPPMLESLHNKKIEDEIKSFLERVETGKDKTGIVMNVVEGKPQFVHRTFAEYFTARWFSENFQSNRSVLEHILFDNKYSFVKDMFDRMLAEDCPLHCAVLDWPSASGDRDVMRFETLLKEGCDANAVDKGSRTVMHIIAKHHSKRYRITELLYDSGVPMDNKDCVLQWTPSQYAVKAEKWYDVEWLLQRTVDRSGLDMIRQRADDTDYIHKIILEAAWYRLMLLLEFIRSIGVNIHQASDQRNISPLHAAICGRQLQVIRWLIKHGADCNTRYIDGQTALHYAVTNGRLDVVRVLVEEGGASVDVRDDCGRTVIDWVKDYMSDPKYREYYGWDYKRERLNEHVKYLQDRACKQTGSVWRNNEA